MLKCKHLLLINRFLKYYQVFTSIITKTKEFLGFNKRLGITVVNLKKIVLLSIQIVWILIVYMIVCLYAKGSITGNKTLEIIIVVSLFLGICNLLQINKPSFMIAFLAITYIFHFGQQFVDLFGIEIIYWKRYIMIDTSNTDILSALSYCIVGVNLMQLSMAIFSMKDNSNKNDTKVNSGGVPEYFRSVSLVILLITILPTLYYDLTRIVLSFFNSYVEVYRSGNSYVVAMCTRLFGLAYYCLLYSFKDDSKNFRLLFNTKIVWELVKLLTIGNRIEPLSFIISLYIFRSIIYQPVLKQKIALRTFISTLLLVFTANFVSSYRNSTEGFIASLIHSITSENFVVSFLNEAGSTLLDMVLLVQNFPKTEPFAKGMSYIGSLSTLLPFASSFVPENIINHVIFGNKLNTMWYNSGLGGSSIAETYYNFGKMGLLMLIFIGFLIAKFNKVYFSNSIHKHPLLFCSCAYLVGTLLIYPRGYFYNIIETVHYSIYYLIIYLTFIAIKNHGRISTHDI